MNFLKFNNQSFILEITIDFVQGSTFLVLASSWLCVPVTTADAVDLAMLEIVMHDDLTTMKARQMRYAYSKCN